MAETQTTFVPQKPILEETYEARPRARSLFNTAAMVIFLAALVFAAFVYFYKATLERTVVLKGKQLEVARGAFEPSLITEMSRLDKKLKAAKEVLRGHQAMTPIFAELEKNTLKTVQFTEFNFSNKENKIEVKMKGKADGYRSIALENDLLAENKYFKNILFANMTLDEAGRVSFDLSFNIDPEFL